MILIESFLGTLMIRRRNTSRNSSITGTKTASKVDRVQKTLNRMNITVTAALLKECQEMLPK